MSDFLSLKSDPSEGKPPDFRDEPGPSDRKGKRKSGVPVEEQLSSCGLCQDVLKDPVSTSCGHWFCRQCITSYWEQQPPPGDPSCPQCKERFRTRAGLQTASQSRTVQTDSGLQEVLNEHRISQRRRCERVTEGTDQSETLLNRIFTELYITQGQSEEVNTQHERSPIEEVARTHRSFPRHFSKAPARGRKKKKIRSRVVASGGKTVTLQFYMLKGNTDRTPTACSELTLLLAGMGRRTITLPESADHFEISRLLTSHYPKLETISGGWLLYKALGGSGQCKLSVIPHDNEGYNVHFLKTVTGGGKNTIYILSLQDELDTSPLPPDANEFQKMPKESCRVCGSCMPLQVLAAHVKSCVEQPSSRDDFDLHGGSSPEVTMVAESIPAESTEGTSNTTLNATMRPHFAACPVCLIEYPLAYLQIHASSCGDSVEETPSWMQYVSKSTEGEIKNLDDVIQAIADAVTTDGRTFFITVSRQNMLERGLVQWQRQKKTSPTDQLRVTFLGEPGVDTGSLRKEFLTGMVAGIEERFFEKGTHGRTPNYSLSDLDKGHFRSVGEIMATSLAQGGPAPNFLMPWCYKFLCSGSMDLENLDKSDVGDDQYSDLLSKVEAATDTTIQVLTEEILNCGYTGLIRLEKKGEIIRAIVLHANLRLFPILLQIKDGLNLYGLCNIMAKYPDICQPLFVPGVEMTADADFIISVCQAEFSERGSNKEQVEMTLMIHLQDFLQELEQDKTDSGMENVALPSLSPKAFLQWITGQGHVPVLQEEKRRFKVNVKFNHHCQSHFGEHSICYPSVAACSRTITFPVQHMRSYADFKVVLVEAFHLGQEFSLV